MRDVTADDMRLTPPSFGNSFTAHSETLIRGAGLHPPEGFMTENVFRAGFSKILQKVTKNDLNRGAGTHPLEGFKTEKFKKFRHSKTSRGGLVKN